MVLVDHIVIIRIDDIFLNEIGIRKRLRQDGIYGEPTGDIEYMYETMYVMKNDLYSRVYSEKDLLPIENVDLLLKEIENERK